MDLKGTKKTVIVGFDYAHGDIPVLIVGEKEPGGAKLIGAYKGQDAIELYTKLVVESCKNLSDI